MISERTPLVVTGASGWFGRNALYEYEQKYGPEALRRSVIICSSIPRQIDIGSPYGTLTASSLDVLDSIEGAGGLLHLAFLTRERVVSVGIDHYIDQNRAITARVADFIRRNPGIPIITTSSGAAAVFDRASVELTKDPYAALKQEEEYLWRQCGVDRMAIVFRVFAACGRFIKDPKLFAVGDFLTSALAGNRIMIRSERPVLRSYVHVGSMMRLFLAMLEAPGEIGFRQVDAVMYQISLMELADEISTLWGLPKPHYRIDHSLPADDYRADSGAFLSLLMQYGIAPPPLQEQLKETAQQMAVT